MIYQLTNKRTEARAIATSHIVYLCSQYDHVLALLISMPHFKSIDFYQSRPKSKLFLPKNAKFLNAGGSAPRPPCLQWLKKFSQTPKKKVGVSSPDPQFSLAAGALPPVHHNSPPLQICSCAPVAIGKFFVEKLIFVVAVTKMHFIHFCFLRIEFKMSLVIQGPLLNLCFFREINLLGKCLFIAFLMVWIKG